MAANIDIITRAEALTASADELRDEIMTEQPDAEEAVPRWMAVCHLHAHAATIAIREAERLRERIARLERERDERKTDDNVPAFPEAYPQGTF